jgi:hypothetical protein
MKIDVVLRDSDNFAGVDGILDVGLDLRVELQLW